MKKKLLFGLFNLFWVLSIILIVLPTGFSEACTKTGDDYALEISLNKPRIIYHQDSLAGATNVETIDNNYVYKSHYSQELGVILSKIQPLSIRLQCLTKTVKKEIPFFKIIPKRAFDNFNINEVLNRSEEWAKECTEEEPPTCIFKKDNTVVTASRVDEEKYSIAFEIIDKEIKLCSGKEYCSGICVYYLSEGNCIPLGVIFDTERLLEKSGAIKDFFDLTSNTRIEKGTIKIDEMQPESSCDSIDWKEAVSEELFWLKINNIVSIGVNDIGEISKISEMGKAGNSRIVYGEDADKKNSWMYYNQTSSPVLSKTLNCKEFSKSLMPTGMVVFETEETLYYTIPIVITSGIFFLFIITLVVTRVNLRKRKKKRIKPVTTVYKA